MSSELLVTATATAEGGCDPAQNESLRREKEPLTDS